MRIDEDYLAALAHLVILVFLAGVLLAALVAFRRMVGSLGIDARPIIYLPLGIAAVLGYVTVMIVRVGRWMWHNRHLVSSDSSTEEPQ